jgi:GNAT superfamily N-acetyltransferase
MTYRIREVDGGEPEIAEDLKELHELTLGDGAPLPDFSIGYWWLAYRGDDPVAFAGMRRSSVRVNRGYLSRSGVLPAHRGHGLQVRLLRARETKARRLGWNALVSDTTSNIPSSNSLIRAGFRLFQPETPWAFENSLYWFKDI